MRRQLRCGLLVISACVPGLANAETSGIAPRTNIAGARPQREFDAVGVRIGSWKIAPALQLKSGYESNVFGLSSNASADGYVILVPALNVSSDWTRHALDLSANGTFTRYMTFVKQNSDEYAVRASGRIDLGSAALRAGFSDSTAAERRGENGAALTFSEPSLYRTADTTIEVRQSFGHVAISLSGLHSIVNYSTLTLANGTQFSQRFRDSRTWSGRGRMTYSPSSAMSLFVSGQYSHAQTPHPNGRIPDSVSRTNDSMTALGGVAFDAGVLGGEFSAGYLQRKFSNPLLSDFSGLTYEGSLSWYPTPLMTMTVRSRKTLENSGKAEDGVIVARTSSIGIDYELLRNLVIRASIAERRDRFRESRALTMSRSEEVHADYKFNRTVAIGAYQRYECRDSSVTSVARRFCAVSAGLSLTFKR